MKTQKLFIIVASVCLLAVFNVSSFAETDKPTQNVDVYVIASALEGAGLEVVETEENSLKFIAPNGEAVEIRSSHKGEKAIVTVDGNKAITMGAASQQLGDDVNIIECILLALDIYGLKLDICEFDTSGVDLLCIPQATYGFALDILRCVQFAG